MMAKFNRVSHVKHAGYDWCHPKDVYVQYLFEWREDAPEGIKRFRSALVYEDHATETDDLVTALQECIDHEKRHIPQRDLPLMEIALAYAQGMEEADARDSLIDKRNKLLERVAEIDKRLALYGVPT
jgi:hypothetical protein